MTFRWPNKVRNCRSCWRFEYWNGQTLDWDFKRSTTGTWFQLKRLLGEHTTSSCRNSAIKTSRICRCCSLAPNRIAPSSFYFQGQKATDWTLKRRFEHAHTIMKLLLANGADPNAKNEWVKSENIWRKFHKIIPVIMWLHWSPQQQSDSELVVKNSLTMALIWIISLNERVFLI